MKKHNRILIEYMNQKQAWLRKHAPKAFEKNQNEYFNEEDKNVILSWPNKRCKKILECMKDECGFGPYTCPFCIEAAGFAPENFDNCFTCVFCRYRDNNHRTCEDGFLWWKSSYKRIKKHLKYQPKKEDVNGWIGSAKRLVKEFHNENN